MTDADTGSEHDLLRDELTEDQLTSLTLPDQIRYAVAHGHHSIEAIVSLTSFSHDWTQDVLDDLVEEGAIERHNEDGMVPPEFYLPSEDHVSSLTDEERDEIHEEALIEYHHRDFVGDSADIAAIRADTSSTDDSYAHSSTEVMGEDGTLDVEEADPEDVIAAKTEHGGMLPVDRSYDWSQEMLSASNVEEYVSADGEYADITKEIEDRRETGKLPHFRICGPTGCGKTSLAENIALKMNAVCIKINCHDGLRPNNIVGMPTYVGDETWWIDGPGTKALLASQDRPVVLILDEVNRSPARALGIFMSMLDHQASITLNGRGGEVIEGDPMNIIVFSTMNEGEGYTVNSIDRAQVRRLGNTFYTDYIGMNDVDKEATLITSRTPISNRVATKMVQCANDIREKATGDSAVSMGIPTSSMLDWARTAWTYRNDSYDGGPLVKSAERSVINQFFVGDEQEEDIVRTTIESHLHSFSVEEEPAEAFETETGDTSGSSEETESIELSEDAWLQCTSCGWYDLVEDAADDVVTTMMCPDCDDTIVPKSEV